MSARSKKLVKLAIEQKEKENVKSSSVNLISRQILEVVENQENIAPIEFDLDNIVDAGLIFENEQFYLIDNPQCVPLDVTSTILEPLCSSLDKVSGHFVPPLDDITAHISTGVLQCLENTVIPDVDINGPISSNTTDAADFPELADDDPEYNPASSDKNIENETDAEDKIDATSQKARELSYEVNNTEETVHLHRSKRAQPENWKREKNKIKRMKGENYLGYNRTKEGKVSHNVQRPSRKSVHCDSEHCLKNKRNCSSISIEDSQKLFSKFWSLSWEEKKCMSAL